MTRFASLLILVGCLGCPLPISTDGGVLADSGSGGGTAADAGAGGGGGGMGTSDRCAVITDSVNAAGFGDKVSVTCDAGYALIASDTYPAHSLMNGITGTNDQVPVPAPGYVSPIPLVPAKATTVTTIDAALAVAVNGVPIYDYTSQGLNNPAVYDPAADTKLTGELDVCNGHSGRGDDYHYHAAPTCMMAAMANKGPAAIIGWAFDGYPIYGNTAPDGSMLPAGSLDDCNGMADATFGFRYHTSDNHPYIVQCLDGQVDLTRAPRVAPLMAATPGPGKPPGTKPPGGVTSLALVEAADGTRTMTYQWSGQTYSIQYKPSSTPNCWDFAEKSYTTGGVLQTHTWCRR